MDFTFLIAFAFAALVGMVFQTALQLLRLESRVGFATIFAVALILNIMLLIDWRAVVLGRPAFHPLFFLADVILFPASTFVGVIAGGLSSAIAVGISRKVIGLRRVSD